MHSDLATRRRVLLLTYHRYIAAEQAWVDAQRELKNWFPSTGQPISARIGNPGSVMRRLYDQRERAILQLQVARTKLEVAKQRMERQRQEPQAHYIAYIAHARQEPGPTMTSPR